MVGKRKNKKRRGRNEMLARKKSRRKHRRGSVKVIQSFFSPTIPLWFCWHDKHPQRRNEKISFPPFHYDLVRKTKGQNSMAEPKESAKQKAVNTKDETSHNQSTMERNCMRLPRLALGRSYALLTHSLAPHYMHYSLRSRTRASPRGFVCLLTHSLTHSRA